MRMSLGLLGFVLGLSLSALALAQSGGGDDSLHAAVQIDSGYSVKRT